VKETATKTPTVSSDYLVSSETEQQQYLGVPGKVQKEPTIVIFHQIKLSFLLEMRTSQLKRFLLTNVKEIVTGMVIARAF